MSGAETASCRKFKCIQYGTNAMLRLFLKNCLLAQNFALYKLHFTSTMPNSCGMQQQGWILKVFMRLFAYAHITLNLCDLQTCVLVHCLHSNRQLCIAIWAISGKSFHIIPVVATNLQSMMNTKLSHQRFWHYHENKACLMSNFNPCASFKSPF